VQRQSSCAENTKWVAADMTCEACPAGTYQPTVGETTCIAKPITSAPQEETSIWPIVLPIVAAVVLIAAASFGVKEYLHRKGQRNLANAPQEGRITLMFTDIESSTKLWGNAPLSMGVALDTHHAIIRDCIDRNGGYEVKTAGDAFMIAVGSETAALQLAIDIQLEFLKAPFPAAIDAVYAAKNTDELDEIIDDPDIIGTPTPGWNGIRVRVGMHCGDASVIFDEVTKGYDYYGPPVNTAARVESITKGGQLSCSRFFLETLPIGATHYSTQTMGVFDLKGVPEPTEIFQITPAELEGKRVFKIEDEEKDMLDDVSDCTSVMSDSDNDVGQHKTFLSAMFTAIRKPADKDAVLDTLIKSWRVSRNADPEKMYDGVAKRVAGAVRREERKADRVARKNMGRSGSMAAMGNGGGSMLRVQSVSFKGGRNGGRRLSHSHSGADRSPQASSMSPSAEPIIPITGAGSSAFEEPPHVVPEQDEETNEEKYIVTEKADTAVPDAEDK
jgi:class 3 adenylate cyclase